MVLNLIWCWSWRSMMIDDGGDGHVHHLWQLLFLLLGRQGRRLLFGRHPAVGDIIFFLAIWYLKCLCLLLLEKIYFRHGAFRNMILMIQSVYECLFNGDIPVRFLPHLFKPELLTVSYWLENVVHCLCVVDWHAVACWLLQTLPDWQLQVFAIKFPQFPLNLRGRSTTTTEAHIDLHLSNLLFELKHASIYCGA